MFFVYYISMTDCKKAGKAECKCGLPLPANSKTNNAKIFNGNNAGQTQFPWQVLIEIKAVFT